MTEPEGEAELKPPNLTTDLQAEAPKLVDDGAEELIRSVSSSRKLPPPPRATPNFREIGANLSPPPQSPQAVACLADGTVVLLDRPETNRFRLASLPEQGEAVVSHLARGNAEDQLLTPVGLAVDAHRNIYVADSEANRVQKYGPDGAWLATFASAGFEGSPFNGPRDVAVDADGNVIVADTNNNRVVGLLPDGELAWDLERFAGPEGADDEFYEPYSVYAAAGRLAVADTNNNRVLVFDSQRLFQFAAEGEFVFPSGVRMTPDGGRICIADNGNLRVRRFDSAGRREGEVALAENLSDIPVVPGGSQMAAAPDGQALVVQASRVVEVRFDAAG